MVVIQAGSLEVNIKKMWKTGKPQVSGSENDLQLGFSMIFPHLNVYRRVSGGF